MLRSLVVIVFCCLSVSIMSAVALAADQNPISKYYREQVTKQQPKLDAATAELAAAGEQASVLQKEKCIVASGWLIYDALTAYTFEQEGIPADLHDLVSGGYMRAWPNNPLTGKPMRVLTTTDGFSAGDLVLQISPSDFYSIVGDINNYQLKPLSFELGIYATVPDGPDVSASPLAKNTWAVKPHGVLAMFGMVTETARQTLSKIQAKLDNAQHKTEAGKDA